MKRIKKLTIISMLILSVFVLLYLYFFDPFEPFHNYELPSGYNDFILCYYKADLGAQNRTYYIIADNGNVKKISSEYPLNYYDLRECGSKTETEKKICKINDDIIKKLIKINANNRRQVSYVGESEVAYPESCYYIVHQKDDEFIMQSIKTIYYNGSLGKDPKTIWICRSVYTDTICNYIDEMVDLFENNS